MTPRIHVARFDMTKTFQKKYKLYFANHTFKFGHISYNTVFKASREGIEQLSVLNLPVKFQGSNVVASNSLRVELSQP